MRFKNATRLLHETYIILTVTHSYTYTAITMKSFLLPFSITIDTRNVGVVPSAGRIVGKHLWPHTYICTPIIGPGKLARIVALVTVKDVVADFVWKPVLFSLATLSLTHKLARLYRDSKIYKCNVNERICSVIFHDHLRAMDNTLVTDSVLYSEQYTERSQQTNRDVNIGK